MELKWYWALPLVLGLLFAGVGIYFVQKGSETTSWPFTNGEITNAGIIESYD